MVTGDLCRSIGIVAWGTQEPESCDGTQRMRFTAVGDAGRSEQSCGPSFVGNLLQVQVLQ